MDESAPGEHKKLLSDLISRLEQEELAEYKSASTFHYWMWHVCAGAAFLASLVSGALASFISDSTFATYGKVVLAVLSFVSAGATGLISTNSEKRKLYERKVVSRCKTSWTTRKAWSSGAKQMRNVDAFSTPSESAQGSCR